MPTFLYLCDQSTLSSLKELVDKGFTCFNVDFTEQLKEALKQLNDDLNIGNGHVELYHTHRTGRYFDFDSVSSIIYDAVVTDRLVQLLAAYYGDYEPMILHTAIVHAKSADGIQCMHRDTPYHQFPVLTLLFDITDQAATTEVVPFSHQPPHLSSENLSQQSHLLVRVTNTHNAFLFHPCMIHRGVNPNNNTYKLSVTFIGRPKTNDDHAWCAAHSKAFGVHHNDDGLSVFAGCESYPLLAIRKSQL